MVSPGEKKSLLSLIEQAQLVYLLSRYPKKQVLDDPGDVKRLGDGLAAMRAAAKELSASLRNAHPAVAWDELAQSPDSPELLWRRAKRLAPTVLRELMPLLEGEPEAAFFLRPQRAAPAKGKRPKSRSAKPTQAKAIGRLSPNGAPKARRAR